MINFYTKEEWLEARKDTIGATDITVLAGVNKWKTLLKLFHEKQGNLENVVLNENMRLGTHLEEGLVDYTAEDYFATIKYKGSKDRIMHVVNDVYPFVAVSPDAILEIEGDDVYNEIKTTMNYVTLDNIVEDKPEWIIQSNFVTCMLGLQRYIISFLSFPTGKIQYYDGDADYFLFEEHLNKAVSFKEMLLTNKAPEPTNASDIVDFYKSLNNKAIEASDDIVPLIYAIKEFNEIEGNAKRQSEFLKDKIKVFMLDSEFLISDGVKIASFKSSQRKSIDMDKLKEKYLDVYSDCLKFSDVRVLRISAK